MEGRYEEIIGVLRKNINRLVEQCEEGKQKNAELEQELVELNKKYEEREKELEKVQTKYDNLRLAHAITGQGDTTHDAKIKINRIVREIDRCIALLNK